MSIAGTIALSWAMTQVGVRYKWGAEAEGVAFDCSGLTQAAYAKGGVSLPRTAQGQYDSTAHKGKSNLFPGDLLFFGSLSNVHHVALWVSPGKMIDAPHSGATVGIHSIYSDWFDSGSPKGGATGFQNSSGSVLDALTKGFGSYKAPSGVSDDFYAKVLTGIGAQPSSWNVALLKAWAKAEGTAARFNPLATTLGEPGATKFNSAGVRNYTSQTQGVSATIATLKEPQYSSIVGWLKNSGGQTDPTSFAKAVESSPWGTHDLSSTLKSAGVGSILNPNADPGYAVPQGITGGAATGVLNSLPSIIGPLGTLLRLLTSADFWKWFGLGALGVGIGIVGIHYLAPKTTGAIAGAATRAAEIGALA